jgi:hypothetical protein
MTSRDHRGPAAPRSATAVCACSLLAAPRTSRCAAHDFERVIGPRSRSRGAIKPRVPAYRALTLRRVTGSLPSDLQGFLCGRGSRLRLLKIVVSPVRVRVSPFENRLLAGGILALTSARSVRGSALSNAPSKPTGSATASRSSMRVASWSRARRPSSRERWTLPDPSRSRTSTCTRPAVSWRWRHELGDLAAHSAHADPVPAQPDGAGVLRRAGADDVRSSARCSRASSTSPASRPTTTSSTWRRPRC